jgi:hypothetical protein
MSVVGSDRAASGVPGGPTIDFARGLPVEPRVLRRVIRLDRRLGGLGLHVPHDTNYVIERARLLAYSELEELGLPPGTELPRDVILLTKVGDDEILRGLPRERQALRDRRELFHAHVHLELHRKFAAVDCPEALAEQRRVQIGAAAFEEIRAVLAKDGLLFADPTDLDVYVEFLAVYFELRYFAPDQLSSYFPAIQDWAALQRLADLDVHHASIFEIVQSSLANDARRGVATPGASAPGRREALPAWRFRGRDLGGRAARAAAVGNGVKAAILLTRAAGAAAEEEHQAPPVAALRELRGVVRRLQPVLQLSDADAEQWIAALEPLLVPAASDMWTVEGRLLYDLQKVCVEQERGIFRYDLFGWLRQRGRAPLRRPLPLLRGVLITKHLRTAARRLSSARLSSADRERLAELLARASERAELHVRETLRPLVAGVLDQTELKPKNTVERVARLTVVEELLDVIVEQGAANLGHLRDAISRNDLKLPDVAGALELLRGDRLLRADRQLAQELAGVYRPGPVYMRSAQRLSSLAFGTPTGRFLTRYVALPYGGAFLALEGLRHLWGFAAGGRHGELSESAAAIEGTSVVAEAASAAGNSKLAAVLAMGAFLMLVLNSPRFRAACAAKVQVVRAALRVAIVEFPSRIVFSPLVQNFLRGPTYAALRSYAILPGIVTLAVRGLASWMDRPLSGHASAEIFLAAALFLNSRIGRYVDEWLGDFVLRLWQEVRMRVFAALFDFIMDAFHRVFAYLERIVYTVDEWLRFRAGDNRGMQALKAVSSSCWFFISYILILVFTLLIEPQVNPIKHFPVVTVSHKLLLPAGPAIVDQLAPLVGPTRAKTLVWSTIWLIPGVFGFLVWELKENWRLYEANRPRELTPTRIGSHGETMVRLLRPGLHSGLVPKLFAGLRSAWRAADESGDGKAAERKLAALLHVEEAITRFVDRSLVAIWRQAPRTAALQAAVSDVRLATALIEVDLQFDQNPRRLLTLAWEERRGRLHARAAANGWPQEMSPPVREACSVALAGLFQRSGAEVVQLEPDFLPQRPFAWDAWTEYWSR